MSYVSDTMEHKMEVQIIMGNMSKECMQRGRLHDNSKLKSPEKEAYQEMHDKLKTVKFGSEQYKRLVGDSVAVGLHYRNNDHHPEHFEDGIHGMHLLQITEMLADMVAVSKAKGTDVIEMLPTLMAEHGIPENFYMIFKNTIELMIGGQHGGTK